MVSFVITNFCAGQFSCEMGFTRGFSSGCQACKIHLSV